MTLSEERLREMLGGHSVEQLAAKIIRRYEDDVPEVKQFLREGEDLILLAHIRNLSLRSDAHTNGDEEAKLVAYFRGEGLNDFGLNGDYEGWSPAETAINAMKELAGLRKAMAEKIIDGAALSLGHPIQGEAKHLASEVYVIRGHAQRAYDILVSGDPPFTARECRASYALTYIPGMNLSPQPPTPAGVREITDRAIYAAAEVIWNDTHAHYGGPWKDQKPDRVVVVQTIATAEAALTAAMGAEKLNTTGDVE